METGKQMAAKSESLGWSKALIAPFALISISACTPGEASVSEFERNCAVAAMRYVAPVPGAVVTAISSKPHDKKAMAASLTQSLASIEEALRISTAFLFWDSGIDRQIRTTPTDYWKNFLPDKIEAGIKDSVQMTVTLTSGVLKMPYASLCASNGAGNVFTVNWGLQ